MSNNIPLPFPRPDFKGVRKACNDCRRLWPHADLTIIAGLCPDCIKIKAQSQRNSNFPEAMNLKLQFACTRQGVCDREFFCINPNFSRAERGMGGSSTLEDIMSHFGPVCPHLIAWDPLLKGVRIKQEAQNGSN